MMFEKGLVSVTFRGLNPEEILKLASENDLPYIEWGSDVHAPAGDTAALQKLAALQEQYGITCSSYGTYFRLGRDALSQLPLYFDSTGQLGTSVLRIWAGDKNWDAMTAEEQQALRKEVKEATKLARDAGCVLCPECHEGTATNCPEGAKALLEAADSPHFQMYWQPNQHRSVAENLRYAKELAPYTKHIHVFHWTKTEKFPLCQGQAVWKDYLSCFDGTQKLLLEFMPDDSPLSLQGEVEALEVIRRERI